jgi:GGDEF domain-containing protein
MQAVLFIDLDKVKVVNYYHGHGAGDAVLTTVAARRVPRVALRAPSTNGRSTG